MLTAVGVDMDDYDISSLASGFVQRSSAFVQQKLNDFSTSFVQRSMEVSFPSLSDLVSSGSTDPTTLTTTANDFLASASADVTALTAALSGSDAATTSTTQIADLVTSTATTATEELEDLAEAALANLDADTQTAVTASLAALDAAKGTVEENIHEQNSTMIKTAP